MEGIMDRAKADVERRMEQAVRAERQERMTRTMVVLSEWGFSYARIVEGLRLIFRERFTVPAVKMRVRAWKKSCGAAEMTGGAGNRDDR
jgi:hypothetical protein